MLESHAKAKSYLIFLMDLILPQKFWKKCYVLVADTVIFSYLPFGCLATNFGYYWRSSLTHITVLFPFWPEGHKESNISRICDILQNFPLTASERNVVISKNIWYMWATSRVPERLKNEDLTAFLLMCVPECPYKKTKKKRRVRILGN